MQQSPSGEANRSQSRNSPHLMESEAALLRLQVPVICPYPEPYQSSKCPPNTLPEGPP